MGSNVKFGIRSKIILGYIIIIICLLASVIILNNQIKSLQQERNFIINHDSEIHDLTSRIEKYMLDMETGQRGFIITGDSSYLEPYYKAEENWKLAYEQIYQLLENKPDQQKNLNTIKETMEHWIATAGEPTIQYKKDNKMDEIQEFFKTDIGHKDIEAMRKQFDSFRSIEKESTREKAEGLDNKNSYLTIALFGILVLVAIISSMIANQISRSIVRTITEVTQAIKKMAASEGVIKERIQVKTNDEINALANATNELLDNIEKREWIQSNIAEIFTKNQGISSIKRLADVFLSEISKMTQTSFGAFYIRKENNKKFDFVKKASFADSGNDVGRASFELGQGLIGQCAVEKRIITYKEIPSDYRVIATGLGEVQPQSILIIPVLFEEEVIAVIELATMTDFTELQVELIKQITETFGLTINSILGRMEIVRLLNESRAMTEELQVQSEELQTQSEELQSQSEELQMQKEELLTINEQLEDRTREAEAKSKDLEKAKKELEMNAEQLLLHSNYKSEFLANMSHELRTPLNSILILSEMLAESENNRLTSEESEFAKVINSSGKDLLSLINDILDLSKVEAGKMDVHFSEVNIGELPLQMERNFAPIAKKRNLDFTITKADNVSDIFYTDEKRLQQVLRNLLSNAFKFTENGSVSLNIKQVEKEELTKTMQNISSQWLEVSVVDTGIGISKDKHKLIFETFQQADGATVRKYGGTGLGLSISKEFVKLLGGWIFLQSKEGKGSVFTFLIPSLPHGVSERNHIKRAYEEAAVTDIQVKSEEEDNEEQHIGIDHPLQEKDVFQGKNILIVDDDYRNIFALKTTLDKKGMNVFVAQNGQECLDIMSINKDIDLILMDIMMPHMNGYETMRRIRTHMMLTDLPIVALTAKAMKNDREKCLEAGASDYISKPLDLDQLYSVLRVWLVKQGG
ncbi:MAG: CHASE3 domain-containing protein [Bacillus sp. (in: firmicutes)]